MSYRTPHFSVRLLALLLSAACSDSTSVAPRIGAPASIELLSHHTVFTIAGSDSGPAMTVFVKDAKGRPVAGAIVEFDRVRLRYSPGIERLEATPLGKIETDAEGVARLVPDMPTLAWEYEVRARISSNIAAHAVHYYVRPAVMVSADVAPDTITIAGPVNLRSVLLRACGRDRFGNCTNDVATFQNLTDSVLDLEHAHGPGQSNSRWAHGLEAGDGAVVVTVGAFVDTAFIRVR